MFVNIQTIWKMLTKYWFQKYELQQTHVIHIKFFGPTPFFKNIERRIHKVNLVCSTISFCNSNISISSQFWVEIKSNKSIEQTFHIEFW